MMESLSRKIELTAYLAIVIIAVAACALLYERWAPRPTPDEAQQAVPMTDERRQDTVVAPGSHVSLPGIDWTRQGKTLVLVLSTQCRFCTDSAPFLRRLSVELHKLGRGVATVAVLPETRAEADTYLAALGVAVDSVIQASPASIGAPGTPVLLFVDRNGVVQKIWIGRPTPTMETEILTSFQ